MTNIEIHPAAIVDTDQIGPGTRVWAFTHLAKGSVIGANCNIGGHCYIESGALLGDNVTVKNGNSIWAGVTIGNGAFIGPSVVFTNDLRPRSPRLPHAKARYAGEQWLARTSVREGVSIGAGAIILPGLTLRQFCMIGAGSLVTRAVPAHALVMGSPARITGWVCYCGQKLDGNTANVWCRQCSAQFAVADRELRLVHPSAPPQAGAPALAVPALTPVPA